jgi:hypothetical protein
MLEKPLTSPPGRRFRLARRAQEDNKKPSLDASYSGRAYTTRSLGQAINPKKSIFRVFRPLLTVNYGCFAAEVKRDKPDAPDGAFVSVHKISLHVPVYETSATSDFPDSCEYGIFGGLKENTREIPKI